jgi:hypothetical protein
MAKKSNGEDSGSAIMWILAIVFVPIAIAHIIALSSGKSKSGREDPRPQVRAPR